MKMEQTECSEMSAYKIQMPVNYPEENLKQSWYLFTNISGRSISYIFSAISQKPEALNCTTADELYLTTKFL
jgi:hypothetical protein